jgi:hypothetical protein
MIRNSTFLITLIISGLVIGCAEAPPEKAAPEQASREVSTPAKQEPAHADEGEHADASKGAIVPGSYEDWCGEHQVPESQCTRCNASLIPAFKAAGDWCETHQLPKSQDLADNPDLKIVRPPKPEGGA